MQKDMGKQPFVTNIEIATTQNLNFRTALWTGTNLQLTVMSIPVSGEVGLEVHQDHDQFIRLEEGTAKVVMGESKDTLTFEATAEADFAILIPAGYWHNIINTGQNPLKLYSLYAPPEHAAGTVHVTAADDPEHT